MSRSERRFQIFISSTFEDLKEQRKQAVEVVFERGHIPIALERFSASNESDLEVIRRVIADCQVYILILGHRYGEIVPSQEISFTELEYNIAEENKLLILPFILSPNEVQRRRSSLDSKIEKEKSELKNFDKLDKFHRRIAKFKQFWGPDDQFKFLVANAINDHVESCNKPGFVKEQSDKKIAEVVSASENDFIYDIIEQLRNFKVLHERSLIQAEKKRELAAYFREQYLDRIVRHNVGLFFESGSTIAYVARELGKSLSAIVKITDKGSPNIYISTNNVLAYLQLWLKARIPCTTFPWSPPEEETYGASYGGLQKIVAKKPDYELSPLDEVAKEEIQKLLNTPYTLTSMGPLTLLLGAASGLQISKEYNLRFKDGLDDKIKNELQLQLSNCLGPHVGSYHNKVFKRFMYETKIPIMIFITGDKINCEIEVGKCHFILDSEFTWDKFCHEHPVAFCIGCTQDEKRKYMDTFSQFGFEILPGHGSSPITAFIARNLYFIEHFEHKTSMRYS